MRTIVDIDTPILEELKRLQKKENKSLGKLISELVAQGLAGRSQRSKKSRTSTWISKPMQGRVDLEDKESLFNALDLAGKPLK